MKIIFDKKECGSWGDERDKENTPKKLIQRREATLRAVGEFFEADSIEYKDYDRREVYKIVRNGKTITLGVASTFCDGGWINFAVDGKDV